MSYSILRTSSFVIFLALPGLVFSQVEERFIEFSTLAAHEMPAAQVYYDIRGKPAPIIVPLAGKSPVYRATGGSEVEFYVWTEIEGKREKRVIARVLPPASLKKSLFVFVREPAGSSLPCAVKVLDDSIEAHPVGAARVLNLTSLSVAAKVAGEAFALGPREERLIRFAESLAYLPLQAAQPDANGGWSLDVSSMAQLLPGARVLVALRMGPPLEPNDPPVLVASTFVEIPRAVRN